MRVNLVAQLVYILCAATSILCAVMLGRGYLRTGARLLLWSSLCFVFLSLNNILLFADMVVYTDVSFGVLRNIATLMGLCLLIFGLIWDSR
jgi:hypothetical protein